MKRRRVTVILAGLTLLVLVLSLPGAWRDAFERGGFYLFSRAFLADIPQRLAGPGRFRFILQPVTAIILGIRGGLADARAGRPPYLYGMLRHRRLRRELMRTGFASVVNLLLMGILLDAVFQWVILGVSYPGAALVVGVFRPTPQKGIAQRIDGDTSLGVTEIAQRLNQHMSLKFLLFSLRDVDIATNSHSTRKVYLLRPSGFHVSFHVSVCDSHMVS